MRKMREWDLPGFGSGFEKLFSLDPNSLAKIVSLFTPIRFCSGG